jgi:Zn-dependent peptidase ImmA (M78 family)
MSVLKEALKAYPKGFGHLAHKSGVPENRIAQISEGADPYLSEVRALGSALKITLEALAPASSAGTKAAVLFRSAAQRKSTAQELSAGTLSRRMASALEMLNFSGAAPTWAAHFTDVERADPEVAAQKVRDLFFHGDQLSPLVSLPQVLMESLQILLFVLNTSEFEGASAFFEGVPFIFLGARYPARMLFTCAHELGHLVAHHDSHADFAEIDAVKDIESHRSSNQQERFAHAFASALLLPRSGVGIVLKKIREMKKIPLDSAIGDVELLYLARIYGVSFAAAARRCEDLGLLPRGGANSLDQKLKEDFDSAERRAEKLGLPPRAKIVFPPLPAALLKKAVDRIHRGELSVGRASMILGLSIGDLVAANAPLYQ